MTELRRLRRLVLVLKNIESENKTKYNTFYTHSKAEAIINKSDIDDDVFIPIYTTVISNIQKFFGKGLGWITDSNIILILQSIIHKLVAVR